MGVDLVLIADAGKETATLDGQPGAQPERLEIGLLEFDRIARRQGQVQVAAKIRIDVGGYRQLGLLGSEAAPPRRANLVRFAGWHKALHGPRRRIQRGLGQSALQVEADLGIETIGLAVAGSGGLSYRLVGRGLGLRRRGFGLHQTLFQRLDALFVGLSHLRDFFAQGFQVGVSRRRREAGKRAKRRQHPDGCVFHVVLQDKWNQARRHWRAREDPSQS